MADNKKEKLFTEFPPVETSWWEEEIHNDLKGADYEKKLIWRSPEGLKIEPYYRKEHLEKKEYLDTFPGEFPFARGTHAGSNDWEIRQDIMLENIETANKKSLFILDRGISSLGFVTSPVKGKSILHTKEDFRRLMKDIYFDCINLYFVCGDNGPEIVKMIAAEAAIKKMDPQRLIGAVDYDPLGYLTIRGKWGTDENTDINMLKELLEFVAEKLPNYRVLGINGHFFNNAGASVVQELAYSLSMANDYLSKLTEKGLSVDTIASHIQFNFGVGSNYFMEIAKLRAARLLWAKIVEVYQPAHEASSKAFIHSCTSEWNQTVYDPYVNLLRATTESMSAVLGGTDSLTVRPFDRAYKPVSKFSARLGRNIQIILKEESYLDKVTDPAAGSYYIENLTDSIIEEAWKIFLKIEEEGGYLEALKKGIIQDDIEATAGDRNNRIATRRTIMLGTNQYPNFNEVVKDNIVERIAFPEQQISDNVVRPIKKYRGSMEFEKLRLASEKHGKGRPVVFMLTMGNPVMRKARSAFSGNFFACAGYEVIDNPGFDSVENGVKAAFDAKADIVVLCSSDEEYTDLAPKVAGLLKDKAIFVVAGAPACMNDLLDQGIENFIHVKSNMLEILKQFHQKLGIEL